METTVATLSPADQFKMKLQKQYQRQITNYFNGNEEKAMKFLSAVVYSVQKTPALLSCDEASLYSAFMACAEYGLYPSSVSGEAYVLPYKGKAQFQLGYQGIITLMYRTGMVDTVTSKVVYEKDEFDYEEGLEPRLVHKPNLMVEDKGSAIGVYSIAALNGQKIFHVMSKFDVMKFKGFSQSAKTEKGMEFSPWNEKNDPELTMWKKTCVKQMSKFLPKNEMLNRALAEDNEDSIIAARNRVKVSVDNMLGDGPTGFPESTEWRGKLAEKVMSMSNGEATPQEVWATKTQDPYPGTEEDAKRAYAQLLNTKK